MKNFLTTILLVTFLFSFSQEIEKMDKKELRLAYQKLMASKKYQKDSLIVIINSQIDSNLKLSEEIKQMKQAILVEENKNLEKSNEINQLRQIIKSHEEKIRILSIKPLVLTEFSSIPEEFAGCSFIFSLDKSKFTQSKFSYFDDIGTTAIIYVDGKVQFLKKSSTFNENDDEILVYSNDLYSAYIHSKKYIGNSGEESQIYTAELVVKDKNGQEIRIKVYGEGGC